MPTPPFMIMTATFLAIRLPYLGRTYPTHRTGPPRRSRTPCGSAVQRVRRPPFLWAEPTADPDHVDDEPGARVFQLQRVRCLPSCRTTASGATSSLAAVAANDAVHPLRTFRFAFRRPDLFGENTRSAVSRLRRRLRDRPGTPLGARSPLPEKRTHGPGGGPLHNRRGVISLASIPPVPSKPRSPAPNLTPDQWLAPFKSRKFRLNNIRVHIGTG